MPLVLSSLTSLKTHLGIDAGDTTEDARLTQLLEQLEPVVAGWTGRAAVAGRSPFESVAATEYYDGTGRPHLVLRRRPVTAVSAVRVDAAGWYGDNPDGFPASTAWNVGEHWALPRKSAGEDNGGLLLAINGVWPEGSGNVMVTYTAGFDPIPIDLGLAVNQLAAAIRQGAEKGGLLAGETFGEYAWRLLDGKAGGGADVASAAGVLARYRE